MSFTYDHVEDLTPEETRALAEYLLLRHTAESTSDDLYHAPCKQIVYDTARRLGVPSAYLTEGKLGTLALAWGLLHHLRES
jgi:hypothetical protein